ncbi:hypothetical protein [Halomonas aquatica]|uniref:Uncharacterized protein n=1 Tax=Halomonas aquatica TaxID=3151123 RepID=A0ABV1NBW8_9GAMM
MGQRCLGGAGQASNGTVGAETLHDLSLAVRENADTFITAQELIGSRQRLFKNKKRCDARGG